MSVSEGIKVLMISVDEKILQDGSAVQKRMEWYSQACDELHIIVISSREQKHHRVGGSALWVSGTGSLSKWLGWRDAIRLSGGILRGHEKEKWLVTTQEELTGIAGFCIKKRHHIPWQVQIHTDIASPYYWKHSLKNKLRVIVARLLYPSASCFRVVSKRVRDGIYQWPRFRGIPVTILPIYVPLERFFTIGRERLSQASQSNIFTILMVSRLTSEKNIDLALEAILQLQATNYRLQAMIVGDGPERSRLKQKTRALGLENIITFIGWQEDLIPYYRTADVFLATSWYEGYGASVIEAMAAGVPVVMTNVGIAGDIIKGGQNGLIVRQASAADVAAALIKVLDNCDLLMCFGKHVSQMKLIIYSKEKYIRLLKDNWQYCLAV